MTNTIKRLAAALLALTLAAGAVPANFGTQGIVFTACADGETLSGTEDTSDTEGESEEGEEPETVKNTFTNVDEFNAAEPGTCPTLLLPEGSSGTIVITRDDGIIDLGGNYFNGYLYLQNQNGPLIVKNGSVYVIDDNTYDWSPFTSPIILVNVTVTGTVYGGVRTMYCVGNTRVNAFSAEYGINSPADETGFNAIADPAAKTGLVYNGEEQLLIDTASPINGIFGITLNKDEEEKYYTYYYTRDEQESDTYVAGTVSDGVVNTECAPIYAADAGTYTVYYMWDCDGEYEGGKGYNSFEVTIDKAVSEITAAPAAKELTWNGEAQELVEKGTASFGNVAYSLDGKTFSEEIPTATAAGKYTVWYKVEGSDNWEGTEAESIEVTVDHLYTKHETCDPTCTAEGVLADYWTDELGNSYSDSKGENKLDTPPVIPAWGHRYDTASPVWTWTESGLSYDVTVGFKCGACGDIKEVKAAVSSSNDGVATTYTATAEFDGEKFTDTKTVENTYSVTVNGGTVTEGSKDTYHYNDTVTVTANDDPKFSGWYLGDTLVSEDRTYTFTIQNNIELTAKYEKEFKPGDVNADGSVNITDVAKVAAHVKGVKKLTDDEMTRAEVSGDGIIGVTDISKIAAHVKGVKKLG